MPLSDYVGQYGESLRRLSALATAQPQAVGQADVAGALPPPQGMPPAPGGAGPSLGAGPPPPAAGGALGAGPPLGALSGPPPGAGPDAPAAAAPSGGGIGLQHLLGAATTDDKEHMTKQLEAQGVDVSKKFDELKGRGFVPEGVKLSRQEKGALLTEFGLRMMAASSQGNDAFAAAGIAGQGLLESIRASKDSAEKEATRKSERAQDIGNTQAEKKAERDARSADVNAEITGRHADTTADTQSRERIAKIDAASRLLAAKIEAKKADKPMPAINQDGEQVLVYPDGHTTPVTEAVTTTENQPVAPDVGAAGGGPGTRVTPQTKKVPVTKQRPLKPGSKPRSLDMNDAQVQASVEADKKLTLESWTKDIRVKNAKVAEAKASGFDSLDAYAEALARKNIQGRVGASGDGAADPFNLFQ